MARRKGSAPAQEIVSTGVPQPQASIGGGLEGAERTSRETALWAPSMRSPDAIINHVKPEADARGRDISSNDGYASGAVAIHRDSIVGAQYRLNAAPNWRVLGVSEEWAEEWAEIVEARFLTVAESNFNWLDSARRGTLTDLVRLAVASFVMSGEVLMTSEWVTNDSLRPLKTAFHIISPDRLSNPLDGADSGTMRRGVEMDGNGRPVAYHVRSQHPGEQFFETDSYVWKRVRAFTGWGRWQCLHVIEQRLPDQSRGVAEMVSVLKSMRMAKQFNEITLQNAVVNATYAAAIESDMPSDAVVAAFGGGTDGANAALVSYMGNLASYLSDSSNIALDGVRIPHLFPGTKLNLLPAGTPGGVGTDFEASLLRKIAAGLGVSYEELSRDYTKTNYSSARAAMLTTWRGMQSKKRLVADRVATAAYMNFVEEEISAGRLPLPPGKDRAWFYEPLVREALCQCSWIGASRGQIDEMKETQAAALRVTNNFSTLEAECARNGLDWRDVLKQRAREMKMMKSLGLDPVVSAVRQNPSMDRSNDSSAAADNGDDA